MPGIVFDRPGLTLDVERYFVVLFPHDRGFTPCFHERTDAHDDVARFAVYVDITTVPVWAWPDGVVEVSMVDLDLDVIELWNGTVIVDDEDEFAEHQIAMQYPLDVIANAEHTCADVLAALRAGGEPFGADGQAWLARFVTSRRVGAQPMGASRTERSGAFPSVDP